MTAWTPRQRAMLAEMGIAVWARPASAEIESVMARDAQVVAPAATARTEAPSGDAVVPSPRRHNALPDARSPAVADLEWPALRDAAAACTACALCQGRTRSVFGAGRRGAHWMVVGEPPDDADDAAGAPFSGPPGQLLDNMLRAVGVFRADGTPDGPSGAAAASLTTVVKCRPPEGRPATIADIATCRAWLARQLQLLQPRIVLAMGRWAARSLLDSDEPLGRLRGALHRTAGVPVVVTYDPAYLLRNPQDKAKAWADLCLAADAATA